MLRKKEFEKSDFLWRVSVAVTVVSGLFVVLVFTLLIVNYLQVQTADPINNLAIKELRDQYAAAPEQDAALAQRIRDLDLLTRRAFFTSQYHLRVGGILLLCGAVVFLISLKNMDRWRPEVPELKDRPPSEVEWLSYARSRQLITWTGVVLLAGGLLASYLTESVLASNTSGAPAGQTEAAATVATAEAPATAAATAEATGTATPPVPVATATDAPSWDAVLLNWPSLRGPGSLGVAHFTNAPTEWDVATGAGIKWKATIPKAGANSPVVWGNRLFLSGADSQTREVYCYDTETGDMVWQKALEAFPDSPVEPPDVTEETGYAAPTMVAHGEQVFAIYANGDVASFDFEGNLVWGRAIGMPENHYGHSSSLIAYDNLLYVQYDDSNDPRLMALDTATGKEVWAAKRKKISWSSPILAQTPMGPQVILCSEKDVDGYQALTGALAWTQECLDGEVAPSAAYANSIVFAANEYAMASAIRLSGTAEAVQSEIIWEFDELLPEVSSPVGDGERFYFGTVAGDLVCLNAETGETIYIEELGEGFYSSPVLVGDRIYVIDRDGTMFIVKAGPAFEVIASHSMGEPGFATPAYLDGRIYLRTPQNIYCIE
ncbi:MAG: PQQ-binding-like beta-propeller repeat protein [Candidatus Hydrogenedentes bacterium]|nr:PQQ-binding-like beta-propeller repeat protein [Candidatus Hydrogenedentota bacterium]